MYILHFDGQLGSERHMARHYVGYAGNWVYRVGQHHKGLANCAITRAFFKAGITFRVALVVRGDRRLERQIKRNGHYDTYCPLCGGRRLRDYRIHGATVGAPLVE